MTKILTSTGKPLPRTLGDAQGELEDLRKRYKAGEVSNVDWRLRSARLVREVDRLLARRKRSALT